MRRVSQSGQYPPHISMDTDAPLIGWLFWSYTCPEMVLSVNAPWTFVEISRKDGNAIAIPTAMACKQLLRRKVITLRFPLNLALDDTLLHCGAVIYTPSHLLMSESTFFFIWFFK